MCPKEAVRIWDLDTFLNRERRREERALRKDKWAFRRVDWKHDSLVKCLFS